MGQDLHQEYDIVREIFDMAEEITRINLRRLCFKGPMESLTETVNLQPAVTAVNLACLAVIEKEGGAPTSRPATAWENTAPWRLPGRFHERGRRPAGFPAGRADAPGVAERTGGHAGRSSA